MPQATERVAGGRGGAARGPVHVFQRFGGRLRHRHRHREDGRRPDHDAADDGHQQRDAAARVAGAPVAHAPPAGAAVRRSRPAAQRVVRLHAARVVAQLARVRGAASAAGRRRHRVPRAAGVPKRFHHAGEQRAVVVVFSFTASGRTRVRSESTFQYSFCPPPVQPFLVL